MGKTVAVLQSDYIPWKGYFDIIHDVDLFVFYDDVQYTKNDWRNRNVVKTAQGPQWLTIPVGKREDRLICEVKIQDDTWARRHWRTLEQCYGRAPHFKRYASLLEDIYTKRAWRSLSVLNQFLIRTIASEWLGIDAEFADSRQFGPRGTKAERLLDLLQKVGADVYVSGPAAKGYIPEEHFREASVEIVWKSYDGYPEYAQLHPPFSHNVTVLDLLFHVGPEAPHFIWGWRNPTTRMDGGCDGTAAVASGVRKT